MRVAVLDVGSFTVRTLVAEIERGRLSVLGDWGAVTVLGEGLSFRNTLSEEAIQRTVSATEEQLTEARRMGVEEAHGLATAAVRRAQNGDRLIREIQRLVHTFTVLDAEEEAQLAFLANRVYFRRVPQLAVVDMGGGSLQIAWGGDRIAGSLSLPFGVGFLTEKFFAHDPPTTEESQRLKEFVRQQILSVAGSENLFKGKMCVVLGGTMAALATLDAGLRFFKERAVAGYHLKRMRLRMWERELMRMSIAERSKIPLLSDRRAEVIPTGAAILSLIADEFGILEMVYSGWGIRHGFAIQLHSSSRAAPTPSAG